MRPKPKDDREEPVEAHPDGDTPDGDAVPSSDGETEYATRQVTKSGKFPKARPTRKPSVVEESTLIGSTANSRYVLVAPRVGKKKNKSTGS